MTCFTENTLLGHFALFLQRSSLILPSFVCLSLFLSPSSLSSVSHCETQCAALLVKRKERSWSSEETVGLARSSNGAVLVGECAITALGPLIRLFPSGLNCPHIEHRRVSLGTLMRRFSFMYAPLELEASQSENWAFPQPCSSAGASHAFVVRVSRCERKAKLAQNLLFETVCVGQCPWTSDCV